MADTATVPALIPLSLLEAIRNLDTPIEDGLDELAREVVVKRLGLSGTVAAQIERYQEAAERGERVGREEAQGVFRLVARRPDAALAFAEAGRRAARHAARGARSAQALVRVSPVAFSRGLGLRATRSVAGKLFDAELRSAGKAIEARVATPLTIDALPDGGGCVFFGSLFAELLRCLGGFEGAMTHDRCRARGDAQCAWRWVEAEGYQ
ncbi:MAG: hypothetical protein MUC69_10775 [Gemmatimonadales bacterium]|jgi:hypothetical protein|nr:hypothetical protein [Gemmatimonadales bacterium]